MSLFRRVLVLLVACQGALAAQAITAYPYFENFASGPAGFAGGGAASSWEWGIPTNLTQANPHVGGALWATNLDGAVLNHEDSWLESPEFDLTGFTADPTISFLHSFRAGQQGLFTNQLLMSIDGGSFDRLGSGFDSISVGADNWYNSSNNWGVSGISPWQRAYHRIDGGAGHQVRFRWRLAGVDDGDPGVWVDDVAVFEALTDAQPTELVAPIAGAAGPNLEPVRVSVTNRGSEAILGFDLHVAISGPVSTTRTQSYPLVLLARDSVTVSLTNGVDLSLSGDYEISVTVNGSGDQITANDLSVFHVRRQGVVSQFPYVADFEGDDGLWAGSRPWRRSMPNSAAIWSASSGLNAWVTNPDGYDSWEDSYLQSPVFDLRSLEFDPYLEFRQQHVLGNSRTQVFYSLDGGPFNQLGATEFAGSFGWHTENFYHAFTGSSQGWQTARHILRGGAGHLVQVRWQRFVWAEGSLDGHAIDDVRVFLAPFSGGQPASIEVATLDLHAATDALGFPPSYGYPGPHGTVVSVSADPTILLQVSGDPGAAFGLFFGLLALGSEVLPGVGQVDLASPLPLFPGSLLSLDPSGAFELDLPVPTTLIGYVIALQATVANPFIGTQLSNAVQVAFLP